MKWIALLAIFALLLSACVPMALMMEPELLSVGSFKHAVGMDLLVGFSETVVVPWTFQYLLRYGFTEWMEASVRAAIPSIFISAPSLTLEAGAKFGVPGLPNAALLVGGGAFFGNSPSGLNNGEGIFEPYLRVSPMAGFKVGGWNVIAKLQLFIASDFGFIPGIAVTNGRFYLELDIPITGGTTVPDGGLLGIGYAF